MLMKFKVELHENNMANYNTEIRRRSVSNSGIKVTESMISNKDGNGDRKRENNLIKITKPGIINNSILIESKRGRFLI